MNRNEKIAMIVGSVVFSPILIAMALFALIVMPPIWVIRKWDWLIQ